MFSVHDCTRIVGKIREAPISKFRLEQTKMCQISVVVEKDGVEELLMEDVTNLVVDSDNLEISNLFEEPKSIQQVAIRSIDFVAGKVLLKKTR